MTTETLDPELLAAQQRLLARQEKERGQNRLSEVSETSLVTSLTARISGDEPPAAVEHCPLHCRYTLPCEECARQAEDARLAAERVKAKAIAAALGNINLGKRYQGKTFADFTPPCPDAEKIKTRCERYAASFGDRVQAGDSLLFLGNVGTGKNLLAAAICGRIVSDGFTAVHTTALKLVRRIRSTWGKKDEDEQSMINSFCLPDLLVIDEVGVQFGTPAEMIQLTEIINERYEQQRPTILISNLDLAGVEAYLGARVLDRFYEGFSAAFEFTWESYRRRR